MTHIVTISTWEMFSCLEMPAMNNEDTRNLERAWQFQSAYLSFTFEHHTHTYTVTLYTLGLVLHYSLGVLLSSTLGT